MPGLSIKPNTPSAAGTPISLAAVDSLAGPAPVPTAGTVSPENDGTTITNPTIAAPRVPKIEGVDRLDDGDDADFEILHHRVGEFTQGDRVAAKRFPEGVDFARLLRLEAVASLKDAPPAGPASDPATDATAPQGKKGK